MTKKITIAIDGKSSCGKSTLAKALAKDLGYIFIDSGAMYRAITLFALENGLILAGNLHEEELIEKLASIDLHFELDTETNEPFICLNGRNVADEIRTPLVSDHVSKVATIKEVRKKLVSEQRRIGKQGGIVMDGRDIGSVVFPNAELKIFVTASNDIRVERRYKELVEKGIQISKEEVKENLESRDLMDSTRDISPLIQAEDAIILDNTNMTREEQLEKAKTLVYSTISSKMY